MTHWIQDPALLSTWFDQAPRCIGLDTEFIRERTYWPRLALVQIALNDAILLVDPLIPGMSQALRPWLSSPHLLKIMHSASEDLVALQHACGVLPSPVFDTQIGAALAGWRSGLGYQKLVASITGQQLDKQETRSNWCHRPLSKTQAQYAADDVRYLLTIHRHLSAQLLQQQRLSWVQEDCQRLLDHAIETNAERWHHLSIRTTQHLDPPSQYRLLRLLRWREQAAKASDRPRNWLLETQLATRLARHPPESLASLDQLLSATARGPRKMTKAIWHALITPLPDEQNAPILAVSKDANKALLDRLRQVVGQVSRELQLTDSVLASRRQLEEFLHQQRWPPSLGQWRRTLLEEQFMSILSPSSKGLSHAANAATTPTLSTMAGPANEESTR